jgi:glycosyltransferase involved in cell wall biosynthesis
MLPRISIVLCTRNRAAQLVDTLRSYERIQTDVPWELVVVDNGSTDDTVRVLADFAAGTRVPLRTVSEPKPGLSRARNCGWRAACGEIVAFTDDDCYPQHDFVTQIEAVFSDRDIGYCGGRILLHDATDYPITIIEDEQRRTIAPFTFVQPGIIQGANMAARRIALDEVGGFDEMLGAGTPYPSEDIDFITRLSFAGIAGVYDPAPVVFHHHRRKAGEQVERLQRAYDIGRGAYYMKCTLDPRLRGITLRNLYWQSRGIPLRTRLANLRSTLYETYGATSYLMARAARALSGGRGLAGGT